MSMDYLKSMTPCRLAFFSRTLEGPLVRPFEKSSAKGKKLWGFVVAFMAAFVSVSFSVPVPQTLHKEMQPWKLDKVTVSSRAISGTASKLVLSCFSSKSISMNKRNCHPLRVTSRPFWGIVSCSSRNMVIAGYWIGPDVDDGWGYIEAFIDRIT